VSLERRELALTAGKFGRAANIYNFMSQSTRFGLGGESARAVINEVVAAVLTWREVYLAAGVSVPECDALAPAFLYEGFSAEVPPDS
jgi:serine/threonine-protein kinase HipA